MSIKISKKKGLNPVILQCPRCGKPGQELLLLGSAKVYECRTCEQQIVGKRPKECPQCHGKSFAALGEYDSLTNKKLNSQNICEECKKELETWEKEIKSGGLRIICEECKMEGILKAGHPIIEKFKKSGHNPLKEGLAISAKICPICNPDQ